MKDLGKRDVIATATIPDLVMMNALDLSKAIRSKQVSCKQVMATYLDHIERTNIKVNAIVSLQNRDELLKQAAERDEQLARGEYRGWTGFLTPSKMRLRLKASGRLGVHHCWTRCPRPTRSSSSG
jgi:hypothetical protein